MDLSKLFRRIAHFSGVQFREMGLADVIEASRKRARFCRKTEEYGSDCDSKEPCSAEVAVRIREILRAPERVRTTLIDVDDDTFISHLPKRAGGELEELRFYPEKREEVASELFGPTQSH